MIPYFADPQIMAVTPAIKIHQPNNILRKIQKVEYDWGIFLRKMLASINALYVVPGPFSFFRQTVFTNLGPYKPAHNTEDMELALRMQRHGYRIENCHTASVQTIAPAKFSALFTQRVRWTYGFLRNALDYRDLFFNRTQGNLGFFVLPVMIVSAISTLCLTSFFLFNLGQKVKTLFLNWQAINFNWPLLKMWWSNFDWFYWQTSSITLLTILMSFMMIGLVLIGRKLSEGKVKLRLDLFYFFLIYPLLAPTWLAKSFYNVLISKKTSWR
jgi:cellulose synthase/poly-beta-1,6-N-acetylglucosamine synthase-like glycosyltransferase